VALDLGGGRNSPFIPITLAAVVMVVAALAAPWGGGATGEHGRNRAVMGLS
jgi:hypothetical protein